MRISDWSSDVCSSDLALHADLAPLFRQLAVAPEQKGRPLDPHIRPAVLLLFYPRTERFAHRAILLRGETARQAIFLAKLAELRRHIGPGPTACRGIVCPYVHTQEVGVA